MQPFSTEQLRLLISFEKAGSLLELSELLHKDQSVISRNLLSLAEVAPVIEKQNRKWMLTELGRKIISEAQQFNQKINTMLNESRTVKLSLLKENSVLLLINTQQALVNTESLSATENIEKLLALWRKASRPVIFVRHQSLNPKSPFFPENPGFDYLPGIAPEPNDLIFEKNRASVLSSAQLHQVLNESNFDNFFLVGFTGSDCIEASARDLAENGFATYVIGDAASSLALTDADGKFHRAERVHELSMANINAYSAKVIKTRTLLDLQK